MQAGTWRDGAITGCAMPRQGTFDTGCMRWRKRSCAWHRFCILPLCVTERPRSIDPVITDTRTTP